jgi:hypothetical protein
VVTTTTWNWYIVLVKRNENDKRGGNFLWISWWESAVEGKIVVGRVRGRWRRVGCQWEDIGAPIISIKINTKC